MKYLKSLYETNLLASCRPNERLFIESYFVIIYDPIINSTKTNYVKRFGKLSKQWA